MNRDIAIQDMDVMLWDRSFQINARGTMLMVRGALPTLLARGGGSIINPSSGATLLGDLFLPAYEASNSEVTTHTKSDIGRPSGRLRGWQYVEIPVVAVSLQKITYKTP